MPRYRILLADNDPDFLDVLKEELESRGYVVVPAASFLEAKSILEQGSINLAIIDLRLRNNEDPTDMSGARLARQVAHSIPKIILTSYPGIDAVREALGPMMEGLPAVNFINKEKDAEPLIQAIEAGLEQAFEKHLELMHTNTQRDVFVVHGHDRWRDTVSRFISDLGLNPIVLVEEPGSSKTVIEQIESHSKIGYVVALLTPDDVGYEKGSPKDKRFRARQNVIFELGYFIGKMGREKVCLLKSKEVDAPSDVEGIIFIDLEVGAGWKLSLVQAMAVAGIDVDTGKIVRGRSK